MTIPVSAQIEAQKNLIERLDNPEGLEMAKAILNSLESLEAARADSKRINWVEEHPRAAQIMVGGKVEDCIFYGVSTADLMPLRDAIDQIIAQSEKSRG